MMKVKLNIKAIILAEKILKKSFGKFDVNNDDDIMAVTYGMVAANNDETMTKEMFSKLTKNKKLWAEIMRLSSIEFAYIQQFTEQGETGETGETHDISITDLAVMMIINGLDPSFVYDMRTTDISDFIKGIEEQKREGMERDRFWTYLKMLPHIDGKKMKSPQDMITFPWEEAEKKRLKDEEFERGKSIFEKFIKSSK